MIGWTRTRIGAAALLYAAGPVAALVMLAPQWRHSPPKAPEPVEQVAAVAATTPAIRMVDENMRVVSFVAPVVERNVVEKDKEDPDAPAVTRFVAGEPGYVIIDGPDQIQVILPDDCDWDAAKRSVGSVITVQARYWTMPDGTPNRTVFMPAARRTVCAWDGDPVKVEEKAAEPEAAAEGAAGEDTPRANRKTER